MTADDVSEAIFKVLLPAAGSVIIVGWWLRGQFNAVTNAVREQLSGHEAQDERRHRQNLMRFTKIGMKLGINDLERDQEDS